MKKIRYNILLYVCLLETVLLYISLLLFVFSPRSLAAQDCYKIDRSRPEWTDSITVGVERGRMIEDVSIRQAVPNPFDDAINIEYELRLPENVTITIIDLNGRNIRMLANRFHDAGRYDVRWDGKSDEGISQPPGLYILRLATSGNLQSTKIILSE